MTDRFYLVTFDLQNSKGREAEYTRADTALRFRFGAQNFWKIVKQCRIVRTNQNARQIQATLQQTLGGNCNILIVRLRRGYAFTLTTATARITARDCLQQIPAL
jgi:hypothetical protein